jgi:hypothetical protein
MAEALGEPMLKPSLVASTALRAKKLDDIVRRFVTAHPDAVVLDLGCGLDTRVVRCAPPSGVDWYDVDVPVVADLRRGARRWEDEAMTDEESGGGSREATPLALQTGPHEGDFAFRWAYGNPEAPFTIVEFGDFECPYCGAAKPVLAELINGSEGQVRLVWRHFPLFEPHPYALTAALAAEAAGHQGAFWPMAGLLFKNQNSLDDASIVRYGEQLGLDTAALVGDPAQRFSHAVRKDYQAGIDAGVHGTPTLFINGEPYKGDVTVTDLRDTMSMSRKRARFRR